MPYFNLSSSFTIGDSIRLIKLPALDKFDVFEELDEEDEDEELKEEEEKEEHELLVEVDEAESLRVFSILG